MFIITKTPVLTHHQIAQITIGPGGLTAEVRTSYPGSQTPPGVQYVALPAIDLTSDSYFADAAAYLVSEEGMFAGGTLVAVADYELVAAKANLRAQIKTLRDAREWGGCMTPVGKIVDTDPDSQRKLGGASTAALALGAQFSKKWRFKDDTKVTLDAQAMIGVGLSVVAHVDACQQRKNELDAAVDAAATMADLQAINISAGWPG